MKFLTGSDWQQQRPSACEPAKAGRFGAIPKPTVHSIAVRQSGWKKKRTCVTAREELTGFFFTLMVPFPCFIFKKGRIIMNNQPKTETAASQQKSNVAKLTIIAMLSAVGVVLQYLEFSVPLVPFFLKLDFSDIPELIGAFLLGPVGGVVICLVRNLVHLLVSQSAFIGELSNFILGASFAVTAGLIYKSHKTKKRALIACIAGAVVMAAVSVPSNYFIIYPVYAQLFGGMETILGLYKAILPSADTLIKALLIFNVPFTLVKGLLCAALTMLIYKPLSRLFVQMNNAMNRHRTV